MGAWTAALDRLEADIERYEAAIVDSSELATFVGQRPFVPGLAERLPAALLERARGLLARLDECEHRMAEQQLARRLVLDTANVRVPRYIDAAY